MKKTLLFLVVFIAGVMMFHFISCSGHLPIFHSSTSIADILKNPGAFTDTTLDIEGKVVESTSLMNYTKSIICDGEENKILLIGNKPFNVGDIINVKVHLYVLYQSNENKSVILVDDNFKVIKGILHFLDTQIL